MNARSDLEWSRLPGLYLADVSHTDRYATYAIVLSPAGLGPVWIAAVGNGGASIPS